MSDHYYTADPSSLSQEQIIQAEIGPSRLSFITDHGVFSKRGLDYGSQVLIETFLEDADFGEASQVLDLGSGYGPITLFLAVNQPQISVTGIEVNERAFDLSVRNQALNKLANVFFINEDVTSIPLESTYDYVLTNPPFRAGKQTVHEFVDQAYQALKIDGALYLVVQKKQGAPSLKKYMEASFEEVDRIRLDKGYWVLKAIK